MPAHSLPEKLATQPTLAVEAQRWAEGFAAVAGIDEAGRGALAGPVVAAALVIPRHSELAGVWAAVRDSKLLTPAVRSALAGDICAAAAGWAVGQASAAEIDAQGIAPATRLAMTRAVEALSPPADFLLIDWVRLPLLPLPQISIAKADRIMASVAAASILAKVTRDRLMVALDAQYPAYGFAAHKGYGARAHLGALNAHGPCPQHRLSFAPMARRDGLFDAAAAELGAAQDD